MIFGLSREADNGSLSLVNITVNDRKGDKIVEIRNAE
jgi:hypothetical protein